jgi:tetratricopeptide (TPR) repeat protein
MIKKCKYYLVFGVFFVNTLSLAADDLRQKEADSLLEVATNNAFKFPDKTIELSLEIFNDTSYSLKTRIYALMKVSLGYNSKRDYKKALEYMIKANQFSKQIDDEKLSLEILFFTGVQYQRLKIYNKAIEYMEDIERKCLIYPERDSVGKTLASSYLVKGFIYKDNLNCDIALEYFNKGIKEYERLNASIHNQSIGHYNKGNCYILLSEYNNAIESFNTSIELAQQKNANSLVSFAEKGIAEVYTLEGRYEEAVLLLQSALEKSKDVGDIILNLGIYKGLFENNLALNRWDDYEKYYELFLKTQLEIKTSERNSVSISIKENSKRFNEELKRIESKFKNRFKLIVLSVIIFVAVVFFIERKNKKTINALQKNIEDSQNINPLIETN